MKQVGKILLVLCMGFSACGIKAQLVANAGNDTTVCAGSTLILTASAHGGTPPYSFYWAPVSGLSCYNCVNPTVATNTSNGYGLTVVDAAQDTAAAYVNVTVNVLPIVNITASDTIVCAGQQVYLQGSGITLGCGLATGICNQPNTSPQIGSGTTLQPGTATEYPTIFGNYSQSCRQQMLYTASELQLVLGGARAINGIGFNVGQFNSNAILQGFTIKIGCTSADTMSDWNIALFAVYNNYVQPTIGWNDFPFSSNFYWDGVSNVIVEICWNNPSLFGSQNNKADCTITPHCSYIYSYGRNNQCDTITTPITSNFRPNVRFGYCAAATSAFTYRWLPGAGPDSVFTPTTAVTYASPVNTTTYYLNVTDNKGCVGKDSINIAVRPVSVTTSVQSYQATCPGQSAGAISAVIFSTDTVYYQLLNSNYSSTLHTGYAGNNDTLLFTGLAAGTYHLLLTDSFCTNIDKAIVVGEGILSADTTLINPKCPSLTNGAIHAVLNSNLNTVSYKLLNFNSTAVLDSGTVISGGTVIFSSLVAGTYPLNISDSLCSVSYDITLYAPSQPNFTGSNFSYSCYGDSNATGCLNLSGGTAPFNFSWSDPGITGQCPANMPAGNYSVTITDVNNCSTIVPDIVVLQHPELYLQVISEEEELYSETVTVVVMGGMQPYTVYWGDGATSQTADTVAYTYTTPGAYLIIIDEANSCSIADSVHLSLAIGIPVNASAFLKVYPNPANDQLFIESNELTFDEIEIMDITGKQVQHQYLNNLHQTMLNISGLSDGVYLVNAKSAGLEYRSRFVKAK